MKLLCTILRLSFVVGVNGVGKTTTIAKLANYYTKEGKRLLLQQVIHSSAAAADQLSIWADRVGVPDC